jgi:hypothetical protein
MRDDPSRNRTQSFAEFADEFGFEPSGVNDYYGLIQDQADRVNHHGPALSPPHRNLLDMALQRLNDPAHQFTDKTVNLILEPSQDPVPDRRIAGTYDFVRANRALIEALAGELHDCQKQALPGKTLHIAICYAQEMNSADTRWGPPTRGSLSGQIGGFVETFKSVRDIFRTIAPDIAFAFSPGLRADRSLPGITAYWPDNTFGRSVDIVGGTWYVHSQCQFDAAAGLLRDYIAHFLPNGKPLALDEMGGAGGAVEPPSYRDNDSYLQRMIQVLDSLGVNLDYVTLFLNRDKWGIDATLGFLKSSLSPAST